MNVKDLFERLTTGNAEATEKGNQKNSKVIDDVSLGSTNPLLSMQLVEKEPSGNDG